MKKLGRILCLAFLMVLVSASFAFASLDIVSTYPEDGGKNVSLENFGVKVFTNGTFTEKLGTANDNAFQIYGPEGEKVPTRVLYSTKDPSMVLVLADAVEGKVFSATSDSDYKLVIDSALKDDSGSSLGKEMTINLHTVNQKRNNTINTIMMFGMIGIMMVFTMRSAKKAMKEEATKEKTSTVNPYKEAKKTGKSVQEIVEKEKAAKEKAAQKAAKAAAKAAKEADDEDWLEEGHYRVKGRKSALAVGSAYALKKKAANDEKRAQEEARKALEAKWAAQAKKKGKKK